MQTVETAHFYGRTAHNQKTIDTARIMLLSVIVCTIDKFATPPLVDRFIFSSGHERAKAQPVWHTSVLTSAARALEQAIGYALPG